MLRARAGAAMHAARLEFQMKRAEQREREALARAGEALAASGQSPGHGEAEKLAAEARRLRLELDAYSAALARAVEADQADYVAVAGWMRPLVVVRGLCARAILRHHMARCERKLPPLHERLAAAVLAEPGARLRVSGTLAEAIRGARAERETALAERTRRLEPFQGQTLPRWLEWTVEEARALSRALVKQLRGQLLPRASALAGMAAGWWVAHTYTDSRAHSLLHSIGIGHGGTHLVSGETYRAMSFWLPLVAAAVSAYLGDRIARWIRSSYHPAPVTNAGRDAAEAEPR
jgi:hypothetical protein